MTCHGYPCRVYGLGVLGSNAGNYTAEAYLNKPDSNAINNQDNAVITVLPPIPVDVAVNITATPDAGPLGSNFTFSINM